MDHGKDLHFWPHATNRKPLERRKWKDIHFPSTMYVCVCVCEKGRIYFFIYINWGFKSGRRQMHFQAASHPVRQSGAWNRGGGWGGEGNPGIARGEPEAEQNQELPNCS